MSVRTMTKMLLAFLGGLIAALHNGVACAAMVKYSFGSEFNDFEGLGFPPGINVGDSWVGWVQFSDTLVVPLQQIGVNDISAWGLSVPNAPSYDVGSASGTSLSQFDAEFGSDVTNGLQIWNIFVQATGFYWCYGPACAGTIEPGMALGIDNSPFEPEYVAVSLYTYLGIPLYARAVPEPGTLALLGLGLAGIPFVRRRRTPA